eukprot:gene4666-8238_t
MKQTTFLNPGFKWFQHVIFNEPLDKNEDLIQNWNINFAKFYHQIVNPKYLIKRYINSIELFYGFPNEKRIISDLNILFFPVNVLEDERNIKEWKFENFCFPLTSSDEVIKNFLNLKKVFNYQNMLSDELFKIISNFESKNVKFKKTKKQQQSIPFIKRIKFEKIEEKYDVIFSRDDNLIPLDQLCSELSQKIGLTEREWINIFSQDEKKIKKEYEEKNQFIKDNLKSNSVWIDYMRVLIQYLDCQKMIDESTEESLEILNYFRSKLIKMNHYEVDTDFFELLSEEEILLISKSIHCLNMCLEKEGGIFYHFGRCLIQDLKKFLNTTCKKLVMKQFNTVGHPSIK